MRVAKILAPYLLYFWSYSGIRAVAGQKAWDMDDKGTNFRETDGGGEWHSKRTFASKRREGVGQKRTKTNGGRGYFQCCVRSTFVFKKYFF